MSADERRQLVAALARAGLAPKLAGRYADAALPVVWNHARQQAAQELRMAADALDRQAEHPDEGWGAGMVDAATQLRDRADALDGPAVQQ